MLPPSINNLLTAENVDKMLMESIRGENWNDQSQQIDTKTKDAVFQLVLGLMQNDSKTSESEKQKEEN